MSYHSEIIATLWDCEYCGTKGNLGVYPDTGKQVRRCPVCGAPIPDPVEGKGVEGNPYYIPPEHEQIKLKTDYAKQLANAGPNWTCLSCDSSVSPLRNCCDGCGAKNKSKKIVPPVEKIKTSDKKWVNNNPSKKNKLDEAPPKKTRFFVGYKVILAALLMLVVYTLVRGGYLYQDFKLIFNQGEVVNIEWVGNIETDSYLTSNEAHWENDGIPDNAYNINRSERIKRYKKVEDGREQVKVTKTRKISHTRPVTKTRTVNKGNGTAVKETYTTTETYYENEKYTDYEWKTKYKEVPIYKPYVEYKIDKWKYDKTIKSNGTDKNPYWPDFKPIRHKPLRLGDVMEVKRFMRYSANIKEVKNVENKNQEGRIFSLNLDSTEWIALNKGDVVNLTYYSDGELKKVYTPQEWDNRMSNEDEVLKNEKGAWFRVWKKEINNYIQPITFIIVGLYFIFLLFRFSYKKWSGVTAFIIILIIIITIITLTNS